MRAPLALAALSLVVVVALVTPAISQTPKTGGTLNIPQREDLPQGFAIPDTQTIETPDANTVVFHLKRPQPSILMMLASGYSPIYAAHVPAANYRTGCVGTGPFKLKEWRKGEFVEYVKNPDYFVKGRPYLDGLKYVVIVERGTRTAALQSGAVDVPFPGETSKTQSEQLKKAVPEMVVTPVSENVNNNIIMNIKKPPFDNLKVRLAVSHAIDRRALIQAVYQGGGIIGAAMAPKPHAF